MNKESKFKIGDLVMIVNYPYQRFNNQLKIIGYIQLVNNTFWYYIQGVGFLEHHLVLKNNLKTFI